MHHARILLGVLVFVCTEHVRAQPPQVTAPEEVCACYEGSWSSQGTTNQGGTQVATTTVGKFCDNYGNVFSSRLDYSPDCKVCPFGYYYDKKIENNKDIVLPHQKVTSVQVVTTWEPVSRSPLEIGERGNVLAIAAQALNDLFTSTSRKVETEKEGPEFQICQHCPLHTIANSQPNHIAHVFYFVLHSTPFNALIKCIRQVYDTATAKKPGNLGCTCDSVSRVQRRHD